MLMRVRKRKTSFGDENFEETYIAEFYDQNTGKPDRNLSVFEIDDETLHVVRVHAEFAASTKKDPPKTYLGHNFSAESMYVVLTTKGDMCFRFAGETHRELSFASDEEHRSFASHVYGDHEKRRRSVADDDVKSFAKKLFLANDPEWVALCEAKPLWLKWMNKSPAKVTPPERQTAPKVEHLSQSEPAQHSDERNP